MATQLPSQADMGRKLRELREGRGIKREQIALALDMGSENWRHYEAGRTQLTVPMLPKIADAYGISLVDLLDVVFDLRATSNMVDNSDTGSETNRTANYIYTDGRRVEARITRSVEYASARGTRLQHVSLGLPMAAGMA